MITQLRPFYTAEQLTQVYASPYVHTKWEDHKTRVAVTVHVARWMRDHVNATSGVDIAAGDGSILRGCQIPNSIYGDYRPGEHPDGEHWRQGNIEEESTWVGIETDLMILSEIIEHVQDPALMLKRARTATRGLVLSTPVEEVGDKNPEHYWSWSVRDMEELLNAAGFREKTLTVLDPGVRDGYVHQIWGCT